MAMERLAAMTHDRMDLTPSNMVLNALGPCLPGSTVTISTSRRGVVQWIRFGKNRLLSLVTGHIGYGRCVARKMPWPFSWTTHTAKVPKMTSAPSARVSCNLHGLHGGMLSRGSRSTVNGSTPLQGLKLPSRVLGASFGFHLPVWRNSTTN
jgi:hypothetical protein